MEGRETTSAANWHFWRKLRLIKKCQLCRQRQRLPYLIQHNLLQKYGHASIQLNSFRIDWHLKHNNKQRKDHEEQRITNLRYVEAQAALAQFRYIVHYYRFYQHEPAVVGSTQSVLHSYHNNKKMHLYNEIKKIFKAKPIKTDNMSTNTKTIKVLREMSDRLHTQASERRKIKKKPRPKKKNRKWSSCQNLEENRKKKKHGEERITSCPDEEIVKDYIHRLKMQIREEKRNINEGMRRCE